MDPNMLLLLIGIIAFGIIMLVLINLFKVRRAWKTNSESKSYVHKFSVAVEDGNVDLQKLYLTDLKKQGSLVRYGNRGAYYCTDYLLKLMEDYFDVVKCLKRVKDKSSMSEKLFLSCTKGKSVVYFQLDNYLADLKDLKTNKNFTVGDYIVIVDTTNGMILRDSQVYKHEQVMSMVFVTNALKMVYPVDEEIKDERIHQMLEETVCKYERPKKADIEPIRLFSIDKIHGQFRSTQAKVIPYQQEVVSKELLDLQYGNIEKLVLKGTTLVDVPMSKIFDVILLGLDSLQNTAIFGPRGSLKTTLQDYLAQAAAKNKKYRVFQITATGAEDFDSSEFQAYLNREFSNSTLVVEDEYGGKHDIASKGIDEEGEQFTNIIIIDEAQELWRKENRKKATALLQAMDGTFKKKYNLCWIMVFNTSPENMVDDLFRTNRIELQIWLKALAEPEARRLMTYMENSLDKNKYYADWEQFEEGLKRQNKIGEEILDEPGSLVQSSIYECRKNIEQASVLDEELKKLEKTYGVATRRKPVDLKPPSPK